MEYLVGKKVTSLRVDLVHDTKTSYVHCTKKVLPTQKTEQNHDGFFLGDISVTGTNVCSENFLESIIDCCPYTRLRCRIDFSTTKSKVLKTKLVMHYKSRYIIHYALKTEN